MSLNKSQQEYVQKAFLDFHKKHEEMHNSIKIDDIPMTEILCRICEWTYAIRINSGMNIGLRLASRRHFMYVQSKRRLRNRLCPLCKESKGIREILWGMPESKPDESKFYVGGCVSEDFSTKYKCIDCAWEGR